MSKRHYANLSAKQRRRMAACATRFIAKMRPRRQRNEPLDAMLAQWQARKGAES